MSMTVNCVQHSEGVKITYIHVWQRKLKTTLWLARYTITKRINNTIKIHNIFF